MNSADYLYQIQIECNRFFFLRVHSKRKVKMKTYVHVYLRIPLLDFNYVELSILVYFIWYWWPASSRDTLCHFNSYTDEWNELSKISNYLYPHQLNKMWLVYDSVFMRQTFIAFFFLITLGLMKENYVYL